MLKRVQSYHPKLVFRWARDRFVRFWKKNIWHKLLIVVSGLLLLWVIAMFIIAQVYIISQRSKPLVIGTSFIPAYAESFGLDAQDTMDALIDDLGIRHFRLVSYWSQLEPSPGQYDFSLLDWQFEKAEKANAKVTLSMGLRQPRWPECHMPDWARTLPDAQWQPQLESFIAATVQRYKDSPALESYQLENEFFLKGFGICTNHDRSRLVREYNLVKKLDPDHKVIISRSNNALGWPIGEPTPDEFGISIYKRVWDAHLTHRYVEYPFPAWYYGFLAAWQELLLDRGMIIHELQAEAWPPNYRPISETDLAEQNKSFNAEMFRDRIEYGKATGMREMYLWGSEYWYYRKVMLGDATVWNVARDIFRTN